MSPSIVEPASHRLIYFYTCYICFFLIRYDTIEKFNVDSKAKCDQLNLAHVARIKKVWKKKIKHDVILLTALVSTNTFHRHLTADCGECCKLWNRTMSKCRRTPSRTLWSAGVLLHGYRIASKLLHVQICSYTALEIATSVEYDLC